MKHDVLIAYLREYADWVESSDWETPICCINSNHITEAANLIEEYQERDGQEMSIEQENDHSLRHNNVCGELHELYRKKNHDYEDSFHKSFQKWGWPMAAIRLEDKLNRFETLIKSVGEVKDETMRDTLLDLANYSIMAILELDAGKENW